MSGPLARLFATLARMGLRAPARVFAAVGEGARDRVEDLRLEPGLALVETPRHASLLLVAGRIPPGLREPLGRVHDQVPQPRATLRWDADAPLPAEAAAASARGSRCPGIGPDEDPVGALLDLHRGLLDGGLEPERHWLPDEPPAPWKGRGDHGQGGEGMMGGVPYGRPMAMTDADLRDGLALDRLELRLGPFFPPFPPGLVLDVALQGDVVQSAEVASAPFAQPLPEPFSRGSREPVALGRLERARAEALLRSVSRALRVAGGATVADRILRVAVHGPADPAAVRRVRALLRRGGSLRAAFPEGLATVAGERAERMGGLAGRAAGATKDVRADHEAYRRLAFRPVPPRGPDARGRLLQRLDEAEQALALARTAEEREATVGPWERPEGPEGTVAGVGDPEAPLRLLSGILPGLEWGRALTAIASLDLTPLPEGDVR